MCSLNDRARLSWPWLAVVTLLLTACNRQVEVRGTVLRDGKPIPMRGCRITFVNEEKGIFAPADLNASGNYRVCTNEKCGLLPERYGVCVSLPIDYLPPTKSASEPLPEEELEARLGEFIPKKFRDPKTSGLILDLKPGSGPFNVNMTD